MNDEERNLLVKDDFKITCPHCNQETVVKSKAYEATGFIYSFELLVVDPDTGKRRLHPTSGCVYQDTVDQYYCPNCNGELSKDMIAEAVNQLPADQLQSQVEGKVYKLIERKECETKSRTTDILPGLEHLEPYPLEV